VKMAWPQAQGHKCTDHGTAIKRWVLGIQITYRCNLLTAAGLEEDNRFYRTGAKILD